MNVPTARGEEHRVAQNGLAHIAAVRRAASGRTRERRNSLDSALLCTVELDDCEFENESEVFAKAIQEHSPSHRRSVNM